MLKKITSHLSTASKFKIEKARYHTLEVVPSQITDVHGKQYPCNNRMGILSSSFRRFRNAVVIFSLSANATLYIFTSSILWAVLVIFFSTLMVESSFIRNILSKTILGKRKATILNRISERFLKNMCLLPSLRGITECKPGIC